MCCFFGIGFNFCFMFFVISDDFFMFMQNFWILIGVIDGEFWFVYKVVVVNYVIGLNVQNGCWNDFVVQQQGYGVYWMYEVYVVCVLMYQFWDWQFCQRSCNYIWQQCFGVFVFYMGVIQQLFVFIGSQMFSLVNGNIVIMCLIFCCFVWFVFSVECLGNCWVVFFDFMIWLCFCQVSYFQCQMMWSSKLLNGVVCEVSVIQFCSKVCSKGFSQVVQCFWWQFFSVDFYQKSFFRYSCFLFIFVVYWEVEGFMGSVVCFCYCFGQGVNVQNVVLMFGDGDGFMCIQQVEVVGGFQNMFVGWQWQWIFQCQQLLCFFFVLFEVGEQEVYICVFEVVSGLFYFVLMEYVVVGGFIQWVVVLDQVVNVVYVLNVYGQMFQIVGDFVGNWFIFQIINLLEVSELCYFYVVQLYFLVQFLGIQCWVFLVIFYEMDVVNSWVYVQFFQRIEVQFLNIVW